MISLCRFPARHQRLTRRKRLSGVTLLELLVVMLLISLVVVLVPPAFHGVIARSALERVAREVTATLRYARAQAIATQTDTSVMVDLASRHYAIPDTDVRGALPVALEVKLITATREVVTSSQAAIRFFGHGGATGGQLMLSLAAREIVIDIDWLTGRVRLYRTMRDKPQVS